MSGLRSGGGPAAIHLRGAPRDLDRRGARWLHRFACLTAAATFLLIIAGGLVTSTGSALAVPDWPLSYGMLFPPMVGGVFYEHGHRMIAGAVATLMLTLAVWLALREPRRWVRGLGFTALGAVLLQAVLGGLTVIFLLPRPISISHATLGQTFFCLTVVLALVTSPRWPRGRARPAPTRLADAVVAAVFIQLVLGAVMRHTGAGLAIPDFPLAFGRIVPPVWSASIAIHFAHRIWGVMVLALGVTVATRAFRARGARPDLAGTAALLALLLPVQIALGALTVLSRKLVAPTTAHVAIGALILATSLVLAIRARFPTPNRAVTTRESPASALQGGAGASPATVA